MVMKILKTHKHDWQITMNMLHNSSYNTAFSPQASTPKQFTELGSLFNPTLQSHLRQKTYSLAPWLSFHLDDEREY